MKRKGFHKVEKQPEQTAKAAECFVYFARAASTGLVKIGISTDPTKRLRGIQTGNGEEIEIVLILPGGRHLECKLHSRFKHQRERGEWFREEGKLLDFLADKCTKAPISISEKRGVKSVPSKKLLTGLLRGFCTSERGKDRLIEFGFDEREIYQLGHGAETFEACLNSYRGLEGWIVIPSDARDLGSNKRVISEAVSELEKGKIRILSLTHPEDDTYAAIIQRGHVAISNSRFTDPHKARSQERWGGEAKGSAAAAKRNAVMADEAVRRLCAHPKLTLSDCAEILGPLFSESTLRRNYCMKPNKQTSRAYSAVYAAT